MNKFYGQRYTWGISGIFIMYSYGQSLRDDRSGGIGKTESKRTRTVATVLENCRRAKKELLYGRAEGNSVKYLPPAARGRLVVPRRQSNAHRANPLSPNRTIIIRLLLPLMHIHINIFTHTHVPLNTRFILLILYYILIVFNKTLNAT